MLPLKRGWLVALLGLAVSLAMGVPPALVSSQSAGKEEGLLAALNKLSPSERREKLEQEARREGKVVFYTGFTFASVPRLVEGFQKAYPYVKVEVLNLGPADLLPRYLSESQANRPFADVIHFPSEQMYIVLKAGTVAKYNAPERVNYANNQKDAQGYWTTMNWDLEGVMYNTSQVQPQDVPKTLADLLEPKYKGRLARTAIGGRFVAAVRKFYGNEQGLAYLQNLAEQDIRIYASNSALAGAIATGERPIAFDQHLNNYGVVKEKGAPVQFVVVNPTFLHLNGVAIAKGAPHPYAAALLYDWLVSKSGQEVIAAAGFQPAHRQVRGPYPELWQQAKKGVVIAYTPELVGPASAENSKIFTDLFIRK